LDDRDVVIRVSTREPLVAGRLVLLLDGWNELDPSSQARAVRDLKALRRDYPVLNVVVGTRRHAGAASRSLLTPYPNRWGGAGTFVASFGFLPHQQAPARFNQAATFKKIPRPPS
jgi:hypothetical protein